MAKKIKKKAVRSAQPAQHHEHNTMVLLLAGGFLVIFLVLFFMGDMRSFFPSASREVSEDTMPQQLVAENVEVVIENGIFTPAEMQVLSGASVVFKNMDTVAHTVTATDESFTTGLLQPEESTSVMMTSTGTVSYYSEEYPDMMGSFEVANY